MKTLIVDDHPLFSEGLRLLLSASTPIEDIACCEDAAEALGLATESPFDLVLLDWNLGSDEGGAPLIGDLKALLPQARIVIVSGESNPSLIRRAIEAGAVGFVPKESSSALLIDALTLTAHGGIYLPLAVLSADPPAAPAPATTPAPATSARGALRSIAEAFPQLTPRHVDVLSCLVRGMANKQIARVLDISDGTVKQHLNTIFRELGVLNRTETVYLLARSGVAF